ncbi:unnamed protein product [Phytophthora fragariaefolia]|uniref:Unnamed protein product n=1 Tax=Phytophthora fragariaefolia TaxID=1490495 RepID=A0A9W6YBT2_9STRA|nr:unnamed protein product [Phytophthora fragariaefolia]
MAFYSQRSSSGGPNTTLDIAQDVGESAASAALLGVSALGSLGWSITRVRLSRRETLSLVLLAAVYLVVSFNKALCRPTDAPQCRGYLLSEYSLQSMMMLGVIVALNFTIEQLKLAVSNERWNCFVAPLTYMKLGQFQYVSIAIPHFDLCNTAPDISSRDSSDPLEPPPLQSPQPSPVRPQRTATTNAPPPAARAAPTEYSSADTDVMTSGLAAIESNQ